MPLMCPPVPTATTRWSYQMYVPDGWRVISPMAAGRVHLPSSLTCDTGWNRLLLSRVGPDLGLRSAVCGVGVLVLRAVSSRSTARWEGC